MLTCPDNTVRKRANSPAAKLRALIETLRTWLDSLNRSSVVIFTLDLRRVPQLICLLDAEGRIVRANRTIERWTQHKVQSVAGMTLHALLHKSCSDPCCYLKTLERAEMPDRCCDIWVPG